LKESFFLYKKKKKKKGFNIFVNKFFFFFFFFLIYFSPKHCRRRFRFRFQSPRFKLSFHVYRVGKVVPKTQW